MLTEVARTVDEVVVIDEGRLVAQAPLATLLAAHGDGLAAARALITFAEDIR